MSVDRNRSTAEIMEHVLGASHLPLEVSGWGVLDLDVDVRSGMVGSSHAEVEMRAFEHDDLADSEE